MSNNKYNLVAENPQSTVVAEYYKLRGSGAGWCFLSK